MGWVDEVVRPVRWLKRAFLPGLCSVALWGCGGGSGGGGEAAPAGTGPAPAAVTLNADGGSLTTPEGVKLLVPAGALTSATTLRVAVDSAGAPALPALLKPAGSTYAITPHGSTFADDVTVRIPAPAVTLQANERLFLAKAQPGGSWEVFTDTVNDGSTLEIKVRSFSYVTAVVIGYTQPAVPTVQPLPYALSAPTFSCDGQPCANPQFIGTFTLGATLSGNGGQFPQNCANPTVEVRAQNGLYPLNTVSGGSLATVDSSSVVTFTGTLPSAMAVLLAGHYDVAGYLSCTDPATNAQTRLRGPTASLPLVAGTARKGAPAIASFPTALNFATGEAPTLKAILVGGASAVGNGVVSAPTSQDAATVLLERMGPAETAWHFVQSLDQTAADPAPTGAKPWLYWDMNFTLPALGAADNGARYRLRACYASACTVGPIVTLTLVQQTSPPVFTTQPRSPQIQAGETASLGVVVAGTPAPTLQWQTRAPGASALWVDVTAGSGGTTANYTTPPLGLDANGQQYRAVATNSAGVTVSEVVTVSVTAAPTAPSIVVPPAPLQVLAGSDAAFTVTARGTEALSYQWLRNSTAIPGANAPLLKLAGVALADDGALFSVRVTNAVGSVDSPAAALRVSATVPATAAPTIVTQPAAVAVSAGNVATFAVGVNGAGPISFQWRKDGSAIAGATAAAYTLPAVAAGDAGNYSVVVSNAAGSVTSQAATLAIAPATVVTVPAPPQAPTLLAQPASVVAAPGLSATLAVSVQGSGPLAFQWFLNGTALAGQTGPVLSLPAVAGTDAGSYTVQVSNAAGSVTSSAATLTLLGLPAISASPQAASVTTGQTATFGVTATGPALRYQWLRNGVAVDGASSATYTTGALTAADSGAVFSVIVYNGAGIAFSTGAVLTVADPPAAALASRADGKLSALNAHACAVGADGRAYCWGNGASGELGNGASTASAVPVQVSGVGDVVFVSAGGHASCALQRAGTLACWGTLGGGVAWGATPVAVPGVSDAVWVAVGLDHACYVDGAAHVRCWGDNSAGQLGDGSTTSRSAPVTVVGDSGPLSGIVSVSAGQRTTCAVRDTGEVYCWGATVAGQARPTAQPQLRDLGGQTTPLIAAGPVGAGLGHACAINSSSFSPSCWGGNSQGQLGNATFTSNDLAVDTGTFGRDHFASGVTHTCALGNLDVVCWGSVAIGNGSPPQTLTSPQAAGRVASLSLQAHTVNAIAAGDRFTCALRTSGDVQCWGLNNAGQTGIGSLSDTVQVLTPTSTTAGAVFWHP